MQCFASASLCRGFVVFVSVIHVINLTISSRVATISLVKVDKQRECSAAK